MTSASTVFPRADEEEVVVLSPFPKYLALAASTRGANSHNVRWHVELMVSRMYSQIRGQYIPRDDRGAAQRPEKRVHENCTTLYLRINVV